MKLSEAIRNGIAMDGPQCKENYFKYEGIKVVGCCALGAAAIGAGFQPSKGNSVFEFLWNTFGQDFRDYKDHIVKFNDNVGMSREQIADWLEAQGA